jgi:F-type H+-transporting ATPase subunit a
MATLHIPTLAPETIAHLGPIAVTNTMVNAWVALLFFVVLGIFIRRSVSLRPGKLQNIAEYILEGLFSYLDQVTGSREKTIRYLPVVGTVFFFILVSNWMGLLPGTGSITVGGEPLFRPANTDLNLTIAMALVSVVASHLFAFASIGFFTHLNKFIQIGTIVKSFKHGPIAIFTAVVQFMIGILEIIAEVAKVMSLSLRLFGNIFAGEVLITVISSLVSVVVPIPFMFLEILVGLIQASVFAMLTVVYMTVAGDEPHEAH